MADSGIVVDYDKIKCTLSTLDKMRKKSERFGLLLHGAATSHKNSKSQTSKCHTS